MKGAYEEAVAFLNGMEIPFYPSSSGFFILVDFSSFLVPCDERNGSGNT